MDIQGIVLVTGAGSGIGRAVAQRLTSLGAKVLVCADINLDTAKETASLCQSIQRHGNAGSVETAAHAVDVREEASVDNLVNLVSKTYGRIDVLVNTAGFAPATPTPLRDMSLSDWRGHDEVHNIGCFLLTRAALRIMDRQDAVESPSHNRPPAKGSIVMLTSLASEGAVPGSGGYVSAKHAAKAMIQTAALENAARGIRVNAVAPTYVSTPMVDRYFERNPDSKKGILSDLPMGRMVQPDEVADAVAFLASPASSCVNGHTLVLDGGASLSLLNTPLKDES